MSEKKFTITEKALAIFSEAFEDAHRGQTGEVLKEYLQSQISPVEEKTVSDE